MPHPLIQTTGRRKSAVARVRFRPIDGVSTITINGRAADDFFPSESHRLVFLEPLRVTGTEGTYDIDATVHGGGAAGLLLWRDASSSGTAAAPWPPSVARCLRLPTGHP